MDIEKLNKAIELNRNINQLSKKLEDFINLILHSDNIFMTDGKGNMLKLPEDSICEIKKIITQSIEIPLNQYIKEFKELQSKSGSFSNLSSHLKRRMNNGK